MMKLPSVNEILEDLGLTIPTLNDNRSSTQDFIPIRDVTNGMIITDDNRYIKIMKVNPINFFLKPSDEMEDIISGYCGWLRTAPKNFQIKVRTSKPDTSAYINNIYENLRTERNETLKRLAQDYIHYIGNMGINEAIQRDFYFIFEYEPPDERLRETDEYVISNMLNKMATNIALGFSEAGNSINPCMDDDKNIATLLYDMYNPKTSHTSPFSSRVKRIMQDVEKVNGLTPSDVLPDANIKDLISPMSIDTSNNDYIIIDGIYHTYMFIEGDSYPTTVDAGWVSPLVSLNENYDVDFFFEQEDPINTLTKISYKLRFTKLKQDEKDESQVDYEDVANKLDACRFIKSALKNNENTYQFSCLITIKGKTFEELSLMQTNLMTMLKRRGLEYLEEKELY